PRKVLDLTASAPGGTGHFTDLAAGGAFFGSLRVSNGVLSFFAADQAPAPNNGGLFTVPASGGAASRGVNYPTADTAGGTFYTQLNSHGFGRHSLSNNRVVFQSINDSAAVNGVYSANFDGSSLTTLVDSRSPCHPEMFFPVGAFSSPWANGPNIAFYGG